MNSDRSGADTQIKTDSARQTNNNAEKMTEKQNKKRVNEYSKVNRLKISN